MKTVVPSYYKDFRCIAGDCRHTCCVGWEVDVDENSAVRFADGQSVVVSGVVLSSKTRTTKSNTLMSYVTLEDDTGTMELIAFQRALDSGGGYIRDNAPLIVKGRISVRDEKEPQLMVDEIRPISDLGAASSPTEKRLWVKLPSIDDPALNRIELILTMFPGKQQMIIYCEKERKKLTASCLIHEALIAELSEMLGEGSVVVK